MFKNLSIGIKLSFGFAMIMLFMLFIGIMSYSRMSKLIGQVDIIKSNHLPKIIENYEVMTKVLTNSFRIRNIILLTDLRLMEKEKIKINFTRDEIKVILDKLEGKITSKEGKDLFVKVMETRKNYVSNFDEVIELTLLDRNDEAKSILFGDLSVELTNFEKAVQDLIIHQNELVENQAEAALSASRTSQIVIIIMLITAIVLSIIMAYFLTISIVRPIKNITEISKKISEGDIFFNMIKSNRNDEVGKLNQAFVAMIVYLQDFVYLVKKLDEGDFSVQVSQPAVQDQLGTAIVSMVRTNRNMLKEIIEAVNIISASSTQMLATTAQLATSAQETATSLSETASTTEEVKQTAKLISQKAGSVSETMVDATQYSQNGKKSVEYTIDGVKKMREQIQYISESIIKLSEQSLAISNIIASVGDIANQSNLLAVNASIEASKAGEHGKGFAVVAQEVRNLAEQSKELTAQVRTILNDVQKAINGAVMATEKGGKVIESTFQQSDDTLENINLMSDVVIRSAQASNQILFSTNEQVIGIEQVFIAIDNIRKATEQIVISSRLSETSTKDLNNLGIKLKRIVDRYKV